MRNGLHSAGEMRIRSRIMDAAVRRAWNDTFQDGWRPSVLGLIAFAFTFSIIAQRNGWADAMSEFHLWAYSALGSAGALLLFFVWNLACAPYRVERDQRVLLEKELLEAHLSLKEHLTIQPRLKINLKQTIFGGSPEFDSSKLVVFCILEVDNLGKMPSVTKGWYMEIHVNGNPVKGRLFPLHKDSSISLQGINGPWNTFYGKDAIYMKTNEIIQIGGTLESFIPAFIDKESYNSGDTIKILVKCKDVIGNISEASDTLSEKDSYASFIIMNSDVSYDQE